VEPISLVRLIQSDPQRYSFAGESKLRFTATLETLEARTAFVHDLLQTLESTLPKEAAA
jgi:transcription-repair coupling factor (superfamily II helicase)